MDQQLVAGIDRHIDERLMAYISDLQALFRLPSVASQVCAMDSFVKLPGVPIVNIGIGYPISGARAPNEHIRLADFARGAKQTARVLLRMPDL